MATVTDLGAGTNNANPSVSCSMTTLAAVADQESIFVLLAVSNDNPTAVTVTAAGHAMTEVVRSSRAGAAGGTVILLGYKNTTGASIASGATIAASWTNTGTQNAGGSTMDAGKSDGIVDPTVADTTGTGNAFNTSPTATTGTPSSTTKTYLAVSGLGAFASITASGQATPPAGYTALTEAFLATRSKTNYGAGRALTSTPVGAQTVAWSQTWGASRNWTELAALFEIAAAQAAAAPTRMLMGVGV